MKKDRIKFLLINPTSEYWRRDNRPRPRIRTRAFRFSMYTSLCVASSAPDYVETQILDEDIEDIDYNTDADVVGVTFMTFNAPRAYEIGDYFRRVKNKVVIFGGFHPTFMPDEAIKHCDSVCIGEAENKLGKMFDDYRNGTLKKFYRECSQADLSKRIKMKRDLIKSSAYVPFDVVQATRGCPNQCKFCSISSFYKHEFRTKPVEDVIDEIKELGHYLLFIDDNIIANREYAIELLTKMIPLNKKWISQSSIGLAGDPKLLELSSRSGCIGLFLGLESVEQANLDKWEKDFNSSKNYVEEIKKIHAARIAVCGGIVLGEDSDNRDTFRKTLQFLHDAKVDALQATILTPFPGTQLFKELEESGRIIDYNWEHYDFSHLVFEPANMSRETLKAGHDWILSNYYSLGSITKRIFKEVQYLRKGMILKASLPLNLNYRSRLMLNNTGGF
jgi:radical SAM superfamily enzyme YgiQ (UPF0313 family)